MKKLWRTYLGLIIIFTIISPIRLIAQKGTIKIFSEVKGIHVYLDETFRGIDIISIDSVETGTHYLKVLKDETIVFGELINVMKNSTTSILIKNDEKFGQKMLATKTDEINNYINNKLDVILSSGSQTFTKGASTLFPGYYSYWGFSNSVSTTVATTDWKIIKGGVKEISEWDFANITKNEKLKNSIELVRKKEAKTTGIAALIAVPCILVATALLTDFVGTESWLHKGKPHPDWEVGVATGAIVVGTISYAIVMKKPYSGHFTTVEQAAKDAQEYNKALKESLGLPPNFEPNTK
jgi:hypothetical protein